MNSSSLQRRSSAHAILEQRFSWTQFVDELRDIRFDYPKLKIAYLAQCMLESANGKSELFRLAGNPTGIKWRPEMTGVAIPYELVTPTEPQGETWCSWDTPQEAIEGYWHFIGRPVYNHWENYGDDPNAYLQHIFDCGYATDPQYIRKVKRLFPQAEDVLGLSSNEDFSFPPEDRRHELATWFSVALASDQEPMIYAMDDNQRISALKSTSKLEIRNFLFNHEQAQTLQLSGQINEVSRQKLSTLSDQLNPQVTWFQFWQGPRKETVLVGMAGGKALNKLSSNRVDDIIKFFDGHDNARTVQASNRTSTLVVGSPQRRLGQKAAIGEDQDREGARDATLRPSNIEWVSGCRNFSSRNGQGIDAIVVHYTTSRNVNGSISWFQNPESRVSAHYIVGQDGKIFQLVRDADKAWHCAGFNTSSIGIEHVAEPGDQLTPRQETATAQLMRWLCAEYKISPDRIFGHRWNPQDPGGTSCPGDLWASQAELKTWVQRHIMQPDMERDDEDMGSEERHSAASEAIPQPKRVERLTPNASYDIYVTPHIQHGELCKWEERRRFLNQTQCDNSLKLCQFLEKVRSAFGDRPIIITSGHRPPPVNREQGGAPNSEHLHQNGCAAIDFYVDGVSIYEVQKYCLNHWPHSIGKGAHRGFVHIGIGRGRVVWPYP